MSVVWTDRFEVSFPWGGGGFVVSGWDGGAI